jgi:hypothetical protein
VLWDTMGYDYLLQGQQMESGYCTFASIRCIHRKGKLSRQKKKKE